MSDAPTKRGILLAIEGIDGAGKTTQVNHLAALLRSVGEDVVQSKEPTDGKWGTQIRQSAAIERLPLERELELFVKDRQEHVAKLILPSLEQGKIVILDRYFYSTIAYQGSRGASTEEVENAMSFAPVPDMVFFLDAPPEVTLYRISNGRNEQPNAFEQQESLAQCADVFRNLAQTHEEIYRIDATKSEDAVQQEICDLLCKHALQHKRCAKSTGCDVDYCSFRLAGDCPWWELKGRIAQAVQAES